jgi:hypothetical protein
MTKTSKNSWGTTHPQELKEIIEVIKTTKDSYKQIAQAYNISTSIVVYYAHKFGIIRNPNKLKNRNEIQSELSLAQQIEQAERESQELTIRLAELKQKQIEAAIRFELLPNNRITCYGISAEQIEAHYTDWLRWLKLEGPKKLRAFIDEKFTHVK